MFGSIKIFKIYTVLLKYKTKIKIKLSKKDKNISQIFIINVFGYLGYKKVFKHTLKKMCEYRKIYKKSKRIIKVFAPYISIPEIYNF